MEPIHSPQPRAAAIAAIWSSRDAAVRTHLREWLARWITLFLGIIIVVQAGLGLVGLLTNGSVLVVLLGSLAISWWAAGRGHPLRPPLRMWAAQWQSWRRQVDTAPWRLVQVGSLWAGVSLLIAALAEPSTHVDAFAYHLPMAVTWPKPHLADELSALVRSGQHLLSRQR